MRRAIQIGCLFLLAVVATYASDPPDSKVNPGSGDIETVDSVWNGSRYDIRFTADDGSQPPSSEWLTDHADDDHGPRINIESGNNTWVTWWREGALDTVWVRKLDYSTKSWGSTRRISNSNESSREPEIVRDGDDTWVVFEFDDGSDTAIGVLSIVDQPDPIGVRSEISATDYSGIVDAMIHADSSHLWVTWVDSADDVGWSEYDHTSETWSVPVFEDHSADSVTDARDRVREDVLGL